MLVVGLTGGIATGKSTVSRTLKSNYNFPVVDADVLARKVVEPGTRCYRQVVSAFGREILTPDGLIDRPKLGRIVFNDKEKRHRLNSITHPAVIRAMFLEIFWAWIKGNSICILDVPLLVEGGLYKWVGKVVVVFCPSNVQLERLMNRDDMPNEDATARLQSQMPIEEKVAFADEVLDNSGNLEELNTQVYMLVARLRRDVGWSWVVSWLLPPVGLLLAAGTLASRAFKRTQSKKKPD